MASLESSLYYMLKQLVEAALSAPTPDKDHDAHHEVELVFINPPIITLNNVMNVKTKCESYIQFTVTSSDKKGEKTRTRLPLSKVHGLDAKNINLMNSVDSIVWEKKTSISQKELGSKCLLRHSLEQQYVFVDYKRYASSVRLELVNLIQAKGRNVLVDFKFKYFLGSGAQAKNSLLHALNHPKSRPSATLEFEVSYSDDHARPTSEELLKELCVLARTVFMGAPDTIYPASIQRRETQV